MSKKILIVDDEQSLVEMVKMRLESAGFEVITAYDGVEGYVKAKEEHPDLIILDILMPNLDGKGFMEEMKKVHEIKNTPIVIFTARTDKQEIFEKEEHVEHYIIKPYNAEEFLKKIKEIWSETNPIEYNK